MQKVNYQKMLEGIIKKHEEKGEVPTLLLHSCCAPCSSYVLEYLSQYFSITLFYYNPNIYPPTEYEHRVEEQQAADPRNVHACRTHLSESDGVP